MVKKFVKSTNLIIRLILVILGNSLKSFLKLDYAYITIVKKDHKA